MWRVSLKILKTKMTKKVLLSSFLKYTPEARVADPCHSLFFLARAKNLLDETKLSTKVPVLIVYYFQKLIGTVKCFFNDPDPAILTSSEETDLQPCLRLYH